MKTVLFVAHRKKQCGIYEFDTQVFEAVSRSATYRFVKAECDSLAELLQVVEENRPEVIIYNYHPAIMPWLCTRIAKGIYRNNIAGIKAVQIGLIHEVTQEVADTATGYRNMWVLGRSHKTLNSLFDFYIAADPTLLLANPLVFKVESWDTTHLVWDYERILDKILKNIAHPIEKKKKILGKLKFLYHKIFTLPSSSFTWLRDTKAATEDDLSVSVAADYIPVTFGEEKRLNRILDDEARTLYAPAVQKLLDCVPLTMSKKLVRANVQQAFVFDTVYRLLPKFEKPRLLCVGSYEDTASMTLQKMGFDVEDIDPMINFSLQEFYTRPSTQKNSYAVIFSTSVIEHDPDDESFMKCIDGLLIPGGYAVITCDYKNGWKPGDPKPSVDARLYTKIDLEKRLLSYTPNCKLVDVPDWECLHPDFLYQGKYRYSFASFVIQKVKPLI